MRYAAPPNPGDPSRAIRGADDMAEATQTLRNVSANKWPIYTLFDTATATELRQEHILQVAAGVLGAVHVKGFSSPGDCDEIMRNLETCELGSYDEQLIWPRIAKLGPAAYDSYGKHGLDERYWEHAAQARAARAGLLYGRDPLEFALDRVRAAWGGDVVAAKAGGREMFAGMIREITEGAKLHFDEIVREAPGILDETPASFVTFNWYLSMPEHGGGTSVYRHRWRPADEQLRDGYGYHEEAVRDEPVASTLPAAGDAVVFDSRNLHTVHPARGSGRRVTLSFFLGITGRGDLVTWS